jgi:hypothetical protein
VLGALDLDSERSRPPRAFFGDNDPPLDKGILAQFRHVSRRREPSGTNHPFW